MTRTITKVDEREGGFFVSWRGEPELTLWIAKPAEKPKRGDVIVFHDAPAAGRLMPRYKISHTGMWDKNGRRNAHLGLPERVY